MNGHSRGQINIFWVGALLLVIGLFVWSISGSGKKEEICVFQTGITCLEKKLFISTEPASPNEPTAALKLKNTFGRWVTITGFMCSEKPVNPATGRPPGEFSSFSIEALPDAEFEVSSMCGRKSADATTKYFKGLAYIRYEIKGEDIYSGEHFSVGNLLGEINS
jgi:hypothetical protein